MLRTNSPDLAGMLEASIHLVCGQLCRADFACGLSWMNRRMKAVGEPHFRGLHHVVTASFGRSNVFVFDILRRTLSASVSAAVARDDRFWKEKLIPITLGVLGSAMGLVPVHCACLELDGDGLLIAGVSGAGKSTLSVALSRERLSIMSRMTGPTSLGAARARGPWNVGASEASAGCSQPLSKTCEST